MSGQVELTRAGSIAEVIERHLGEAEVSIDAALYRFDNPRLAGALRGAAGRSVRVRVVLDRNKFEESRSTREIFSSGAIPFRLSSGRQGAGSKMHHKFAVLDGRVALAGSYNWTLESEDHNFENLLVVREPAAVETFRREFEALWEAAEEVKSPRVSVQT